MGIFGMIKKKTQKVFEKKPCSICGAEVGPFSRSGLKDGLICSSCKRKLSPFYNFTGVLRPIDAKNPLKSTVSKQT